MELNIHINVTAEKQEGISQLKLLIKSIKDGTLKEEILQDTSISSVDITVERVR